MNENPSFFLSITRLKLRGLGQLPSFHRLNSGSLQQARAAEGLLQGVVIADSLLTFYTLTLWQDQKSMQKYMGSGAHLRAMPKLRGICSEAATTRTSWSESRLPSAPEALALLRSAPKFVPLEHPSPNHDARILPDKTSLWLQSRIK